MKEEGCKGRERKVLGKGSDFLREIVGGGAEEKLGVTNKEENKNI